MSFLFSKKFNPDSDIPDLKGKVIIVTGGNAGVGYGTVQHLARHGAKVYLGARNEAKATAAIEQLKKEGLQPGNGEILWLDIDLSDPRKAKAAAEAFLEMEKRLDVLVNNAAMILGAYQKTMHDIQDVMMVNHISPFVFTSTLLPLMKETAKEPGADVRIVCVSSDSIFFVPKGVHFANREDFNAEFPNMSMASMKRYGLSKLANVLYAKELQKRLDEGGVPIIVCSLHPGHVNSVFDSKVERSTGNAAFRQSLSPIVRGLWVLGTMLHAVPISKGAYTSVFAAASPEVRAHPETYKGAYLQPVAKVGKPTDDGNNSELAKELWVTTEKILEEIGM